MLAHRETAFCEGRQGDWLVDVTLNGHTVKLPTAHKYFTKKYRDGCMEYKRDAFYNFRGLEEKGARYLEALREHKRVVLTDDEVGPGPDRYGAPYEFKGRKNYIAVYDVDEIAATEHGMRFRFIKNVAPAVRKGKRRGRR